MDKGKETGKEVSRIFGSNETESEWKSYFRKRRDRLVGDIATLETVEDNDEKNGTKTPLGIMWTTNLLKWAQEFLEIFDTVNTKLLQMTDNITTLEKRLELAEAELAELEKKRKIQGL